MDGAAPDAHTSWSTQLTLKLHSSSPEMCSATHFTSPARRQWLCHCHPPGTHRWLCPTWVPCTLQLCAALFGSSWVMERPFLMAWGESFPRGSCARPVVLSRQHTCWVCGRRQYSGSGECLHGGCWRWALFTTTVTTSYHLQVVMLQNLYELFERSSTTEAATESKGKVFVEPPACILLQSSPCCTPAAMLRLCGDTQHCLP